MVFCPIKLLKNLVLAIYAVLSRFFCCDLRTFVWRNIEPKLCLWRKKDKYHVCICFIICKMNLNKCKGKRIDENIFCEKGRHIMFEVGEESILPICVLGSAWAVSSSTSPIFCSYTTAAFFLLHTQPSPQRLWPKRAVLFTIYML